MYVWVDTSNMSGDTLKAAQAEHLKTWLNKMKHAFGQESRTVEAMFKLREVAEQNADVWEALLALSKFDGYDKERGGDGSRTCMKETKPEGIWAPPTGNKAKRWSPKPKDQTPALF